MLYAENSILGQHVRIVLDHAETLSENEWDRLFMEYSKRSTRACTPPTPSLDIRAYQAARDALFYLLANTETDGRLGLVEMISQKSLFLAKKITSSTRDPEIRCLIEMSRQWNVS